MKMLINENEAVHNQRTPNLKTGKTLCIVVMLMLVIIHELATHKVDSQTLIINILNLGFKTSRNTDEICYTTFTTMNTE